MIDDPTRRTTTPDQARMARLGSWLAAVCVDPDGQESYWLLSPDQVGEPGCACERCCPHEQLTGPVRPTR